jgi:hypothetical protein
VELFWLVAGAAVPRGSSYLASMSLNLEDILTTKIKVALGWVGWPAGGQREILQTMRVTRIDTEGRFASGR